MKKIIRPAFTFLVLAVSIVCARSKDSSRSDEVFQFHFTLHKPLVYSVDVEYKRLTSMRVADRPAMTSITTDAHFKLKLLPTETNSDGTTLVFYEPSDFTEQITSSAANGEVETSLTNLEVYSTQNGLVTVDTTQGIGLSEAAKIKAAVYPPLLSGYFIFDSAGRMLAPKGDFPFMDSWTPKLKQGDTPFLFSFPSNRLALHDSWTNQLVQKDYIDITLDKPINQELVYSRAPDESTTNGLLASFPLTSTISLRNLTGHVDQSGEQTRFAIPNFDETTSAQILFDRVNGCLVRCDRSDKSQADCNAVYRERSVLSNIKTESRVVFQLITP